MADLLSFRAICQAILQDPSRAARLQCILEGQTHGETDYSGMDCVPMAMHYVLEELASLAMELPPIQWL